MIIREVERGGGVIVRAMKARQKDADTLRDSFAGLHLSSIIGDYIDCVYPTRQTEIADKQRVSLYELGDIIEELIADELRKRTGFSKPEPKKHQGVWCSPDGWSRTTKTIDEVKSTRISSGRIVLRPDGRVDGFEDDPKLIKYFLQIKAYMHVWGAKRGRLHVVFLNGNWKPPFPDPRTFVVRPETDHELADTWDMLTDHAKERRL